MDNLNLWIKFKMLLIIVVLLLLTAPAFGQNTTAMANSTVTANATSTAPLAYGGSFYLGNLLACYLCIFLCRLLLTV